MSTTDRRDAFPGQLHTGLTRCCLTGGSVLVAVSGGADSVALLRGLIELQTESRMKSQSDSGLKIVVAHINHQLREDSDDDADWVQTLANDLGVRCRIETADVRLRMSQTRESLEEAARSARYDALARIAEEEDCNAIAVAHTADDQAETVLHHLIRGTSMTGLRGMQWRRPAFRGEGSSAAEIVRPMLEVQRFELEAWLLQIGQDFRTDATNADRALTRNRIRHHLLPMLEQEFNPQVRRALCTLAGHASEVSQLLRQLAEQHAKSAVVQASESSIRIDCRVLADQPALLIRETLLLVWQQAQWPQKRMGHREWQSLADLVSQNSGAVSLPEKIDARRRAQLLVLSRHVGQKKN